MRGFFEFDDALHETQLARLLFGVFNTFAVERCRDQNRKPVRRFVHRQNGAFKLKPVRERIAEKRQTVEKRNERERVPTCAVNII